MVCSKSLEASITVEPGEGALNDPTAWVNGEAGLVGEFSNDLDRSGVGDARAVVGAVGMGEFDKRITSSRPLEQRHGAIAVLDVGGMHEEFERATTGIDHGIALTAHDLLARVIPAWASSLGGLHALAVDHRC